MRRYLLDTPILAALLIGRQPARELVEPWLVNHEVVTSVVVYGEIYEYIRGFRNFEERYRPLQVLIQECSIIPLSIQIMETYANIRRSMRRPHGAGLIGDIDTLIAATCV
jgi:predicted nucleic acid-binding protein